MSGLGFGKTLGQSCKTFWGSSFIPKASYPGLNLVFTLQHWVKSKILRNRRRARAERKINHFQPVLAKGVGSRLTPEKSWTCPQKKGAGTAHRSLTWTCYAGDKGIWVHPCSMEDLSLRALLRLLGLNFQPKLCDPLQVPVLRASAEGFGKHRSHSP